MEWTLSAGDTGEDEEMPKTLPNERVSTKCMLIRLESGSLMKIK